MLPRIELLTSFRSVQVGQHCADVWRFDVSSERSEHNGPHRFADQDLRLYCSSKRTMQYAYGRSTVRRILAWYLKDEPENLQVRRTGFGKPFLESRLHIDFSYSHSSSTFMLAISPGCPVGIDLEEISRVELLSDQATRSILHPLEAEGYCELMADDLTRLWVAKEAATKAYGLGLRIPFNEVETRQVAGRIVSACIRGIDFDIEELRVPSGNRSCLAVKRNVVRSANRVR